jgi:hypothetical protein
MRTRFVLPVVLLLMLLASFAVAQTTTTYQASKGTVDPGNRVTALLDLGGSFDTIYGFGAQGCYYGTCDLSYSGHPFTYTLPDGTQATFNNLQGTADFRVQADVKIDGTATGTDSTGAPVSITVHVDFAARCRSGRGGGCTKIFLDGTLDVTK